MVEKCWKTNELQNFAKQMACKTNSLWNKTKQNNTKHFLNKNKTTDYKMQKQDKDVTKPTKKMLWKQEVQNKNVTRWKRSKMEGRMV